ncbi:hypothetical protein CEE37_02525 [candidate division LCP-89 bacterium B3_LCP]|uniref:Secretion system C-terminal sorting domain-containing protein n=1 Tax=candidate division LCP-89 bacterium B3_LCP TaxID=2012998 RepID=A0A532V5V1_UNCL8|nr:MAG: hypothetical protein CEE37_02525 [candidate division LCP-89 bacterium B3_LCP]
MALIFLISFSAFGYTLSGDIDGAEWFGGITYVYALSLDIANPGFYIGLALLGNGMYLVFNVPEGTYILTAFQDRDGNLIPSVDDYMGYYGGSIPTPVEVTGNVNDLDITVEPLPFATISGVVSCPEGEFGLTYTLAASDPEFENIVHWGIPLTLDGNVEYTLFVDPGEYYVMAYLDADFSFSRTSDDPQMFYGAPDFPVLLDVTSSSAQNIDLDMLLPLDVELSMDPQGIPIIIPASGGSFDYTIDVQNTGTDPAETHLWIDVTLPDGSNYGPVLGPVMLNLPAGFSATRDRTQAIPGAAPGGDYSYNGYMGIYPAIVWDDASFEFEKSGTDYGSTLGSWTTWGDDLSVVNNLKQATEYELCKAYPNPFNPSTVLRFKSQDASKVNLTVFDISGRKVVELINGWRDAGIHEVTFDASKLTSGIYFYRFIHGNNNQTGKLVLLK